MRYFLVIILVLGACSDDHWANDDRRVIDLSESERAEFCEDHAADETGCDPEMTDRQVCEDHLRGLAGLGCAVVSDVSRCYERNDQCGARDNCGWNCQVDCYSRPLDTCEEDPACQIRLGSIETENQCLEQVPAHCEDKSGACNSAPSYGQAPDGTCYLFPSACQVPENWSSRIADGPCIGLAELDRCQ